MGRIIKISSRLEPIKLQSSTGAEEKPTAATSLLLLLLLLLNESLFRLTNRFIQFDLFRMNFNLFIKFESNLLEKTKEKIK